MPERDWRAAGENMSKLVNSLLPAASSADGGDTSVRIAPYSTDPSDTWQYVSLSPAPSPPPDSSPLLGDVFGADSSYAGIFWWSADRILLQLDSAKGDTDLESIATYLLR